MSIPCEVWVLVFNYSMKSDRFNHGLINRSSYYAFKESFKLDYYGKKRILVNDLLECLKMNIDDFDYYDPTDKFFKIHMTNNCFKYLIINYPERVFYVIPNIKLFIENSDYALEIIENKHFDFVFSNNILIQYCVIYKAYRLVEVLFYKYEKLNINMIDERMIKLFIKFERFKTIKYIFHKNYNELSHEISTLLYTNKDVVNSLCDDDLSQEELKVIISINGGDCRCQKIYNKLLKCRDLYDFIIYNMNSVHRYGNETLHEHLLFNYKLNDKQRNDILLKSRFINHRKMIHQLRKYKFDIENVKTYLLNISYKSMYTSFVVNDLTYDFGDEFKNKFLDDIVEGFAQNNVNICNTQRIYYDPIKDKPKNGLEIS
jgi:hypothetical protein